MSILEKIAPSLALKRLKLLNAVETEKRKYKNNKKLNEFLNYAHHGASTRKNAFRGMDDNLYSADEDIGENKNILMARSRQLYMGNSIGVGAIRKMRTNIVGKGIRLKSKINKVGLNLTDEQAYKIQDEIQTIWELWADSKECDITRQNNFYQLQSLLVLTQLIDGECFVLLPYRQKPKDIFELKIQLIDSARCQQPSKVPPEKNIKNGVEINKDGEPIAYYFVNSLDDLDAKKFDVYGKNGRRNILIIMEKERIGQRRGVPLLAPVIEMLSQITKYTNSELTNAVVSAMFTVFITRDRDTDPQSSLIPLEEQNEDDKNYQLGNGTVVELEPGQKIEAANTQRANSNFESFLFQMSKLVGTALEIPVEVLLAHFSASYSASRAALEEAYKTYKMRREWLISDFCQPVFEEFLDEAVAKGYLKLPGYDNPLKRKYYQGAEWYGEAQTQLDPLKEVKAAQIRILSGISTIAREARSITGTDWKDNIEQLKSEMALLGVDMNDWYKEKIK